MLTILIMSVVAGMGFFFGRGIDLADQWPFFEALRTTSAIVFGVMGALLAIVYPEIIKQGFRAQSETSLSKPANIHRIVDPLAQSAILLIALVLLGPLFAWAKATLDGNHYIQGCSFALVCMLSAWQAWILWKVLMPLDVLRSHTDLASAKAKRREQIHKNIGDIKSK